MMSHCPTCSHCANPCGVLHSASLRYGDSAQCHAAARLAPVQYATVARSLRSLRPHHSRIPPAQAFRQSWLRCERVKQRVITTGHPASEDSNIALERIMQNFISTETSQTAMACEQVALFGRDPRPRRVRQSRDLERGRGACRDRGSHPHPGRRRRTGRHAARRRTGEPPLGLLEYAARPGPAPRPRHRQDRARDERPRPRAGRLRDQVARTGTPDRPGPEPRCPARCLRDHARPRRRGIPRRDRRYLASAPRIAQQPDRQTHLSRHRRTRLPARP